MIPRIAQDRPPPLPQLSLFPGPWLAPWVQPCRLCHGAVATDASRCPHCGTRLFNEYRKFGILTVRVLGGVVMVLAIVLLPLLLMNTLAQHIH